MPTPILVLNCGSSSVKYQVIDTSDESVWASGLVEKIGLPEGRLKHRTPAGEQIVQAPIPDHKEALRLVVRAFADHGPDLDQVVAVGHRTVHGGQRFRETIVIDDEVIAGMTELSGLAPLHNPPVIAGIKAAQAVLTAVPHVAIFDTAFFSSLPPEAYTYAIDKTIAEQFGIRKYGFHGTSHSYVSKRTAEFLGRDLGQLDQIVCHLGNGASISAIRGGQAVDTSMGLTPLPGLVMGTRSGDVDPGVFSYLSRVADMDSSAVFTLLNNQSGVAGLAGGTSDFRDLRTKIEAGNADAKLAFDVYIHRLIGYIGAYIAVLGHLDVLVFTAGVGENDQDVRREACQRLTHLGCWLDPVANQAPNTGPRVISTPDSPVTILVVPTNEELAMARETVAAIG